VHAAQVVHATTVSAGWKWLAILIAVGFIVLMFVFVGVASGQWNPWKLVEGQDGISSTSKFQWLVWLLVILFAYVALWILRAKQGDYGAIHDVPNNVLTVLGLSTATAAAAKGITTGYVKTNRITKRNAADPPAAPSVGGILQDDTNFPEIAKIQMIAFTFVAVGIFLATVIHQIAHNPPTGTLPDIDTSLLVLMGISQGGYLAKKLVSY